MPDPIDNSRPWVSSTPLRLHNVQPNDVTGRYELLIDDPAVLRVSVEESGNANPIVRIVVDWGDGTTSASEPTSINRVVQFDHVYLSVGFYTIAVRATNSDGTMSRANTSGETPNVNAVVAVHVGYRRAAALQNPSKWRGPALPLNSIAEAVSSVQDVFAPVFTNLAANAATGARVIFVASLEEQFDVNAQVILSQDGKLISAARILARTGNEVQLDAEISDDYDALSAVVELKRQNISRQSVERQVAPANWFLPVVTDNDLIKASLRILLATHPGERVMRPEIGSRLDEIPFDQNDALTEQLIRTEVVDAAAKYEPRAILDTMQVNRSGDEIRSTLIFQLTDGSSSFDLQFALKPV